MMRAPLLLAMLLLAPCAGAETWLRVEAPSAALRAELPARAIDYGAFVWMPETGAPAGVLGARVQRNLRPFDLSIDGVRFDPTDAPASSDPWWQATAHSGPDFRLLQLHGPPRAADLDALRAANVRPVRYLAPFSYIVWASAEDLQSLAGRSTAIRWSGAFLPAQRVPPQSRNLDAGPTRAMALVDAASADAVIAALPSTRLVERTAR